MNNFFFIIFSCIYLFFTLLALEPVQLRSFNFFFLLINFYTQTYNLLTTLTFSVINIFSSVSSVLLLALEFVRLYNLQFYIFY